MQGFILARPEDRQDNGSKPGSSWLRNWRWAVMALLAAVFAGWFIRGRWHELGFNWAVFAASFLGLRWRWMIAGAALSMLTYPGRALRWAVMVERLHPNPSRWDLCKATVIGFAAVVLLGRPGEFVRPYLIASKLRVPFSSQLAAWFLERICDLLAVLLIFGFALTQVNAAHLRVGPKLAWVFETGGYVLAAFGAVAIVILVLLGKYSVPMRRNLLNLLRFLPSQQHQKADRIVTAFLDGTSAIQAPSTIAKLVGFTVLEWLIIVMCSVCLFQSYPAASGLGMREVFIFLGFVAFGSIVQIPGVGGGVQIVSILVLTELFGLHIELATSMAITMWIVSFVMIVPFGVWLAFHEGLNWKRLRELDRQAVCEAGAVENKGEIG
ncbi:MAG: lysylphosphatidylglycerol synthase transmembrane domain-containing protein [Bryobacteraceae bacterium]